MSTKLTSLCQPSQDGGPPAECYATFTVDGQRGNQKYLVAGVATLEADDLGADTYLWKVTSSPPQCDYLLTGSTQATAKLTLPGSGAYVVQLSVTKGDCITQHRVILWVATPRRLYRIPADSETLRFDGDREWAGDMALMAQQVDWNLPTPEQKAALDAARQPNAENPFATLDDLPEGSPQPCDLTEDEVAAIKEASDPSAENPFATLDDLPEGGGQPCELTDAEIAAVHAAKEPSGTNPFVTDSDRRRFAPTADQKEALSESDEPNADNPFVTATHLGRVAPTGDQKDALDAADDPSQCNPFVTDSYLQTYVPTPGQRQALDRAEEPGADNPFVTESRLERDTLTADQRAAIRRARAPNWENPFVTDSHLREFSPTTDQRAALDHARCPDGENAFVTESHLEEFAPTPEQRAALDSAEDPDATNPFITKSALPEVPEVQLTDDQEAAVDAAEDPGASNPFITRSALPKPQLTPEQEAAIDAADRPSAINPFLTQSALPEIPEPQLSDEQVKAIQTADNPREGNPFITQRALPACPKPQLTDDQEAAIDAAERPSTSNPFVTQSALPEIPKPQLNNAQLRAIQTADDPRQGNPFITKSALPDPSESQLTDKQVKAIQAADDPREGNPFITQSALPEPQLTGPQLDAIQAAQAPEATNPFVTEKALPPIPEPQLTGPQLDAIQAAQAPEATNPFVTEKALPPIPEPQLTEPQLKAVQKARDPGQDNPFITRVELPLGVTLNQKEALDHANQPHATNPLATLADLGQAGVFMRTVAAGTLDLSVMHATPEAGLGGLEVVDILAERGVATLHFEGYRLARRGSYLIKTLPLRADAKTASSPPADPLGFRQFIVVQLVEFNERGFELQMIQPLHEVNGVPALGPCMVEVSEILSISPEPQQVTLAQAVKRYYSLIQTEDYALAWPMLSERFREDRDLTFERYVRGWERSGPTILVGLHRCQVDTHQATLVLDLDLPSEGAAEQRSTHLIRFEFVRDETLGDPRFGHWLYDAGREVALSAEIQMILGQLTQAERERLGTLQDPCTPEVTAKFTLQRFERGLMWWFEQTQSLENIWVLDEAEADFSRGASWHRHVDDWPGEEEHSCDEARANGPRGPVRGFGWLWCKNADVRQALGAPLAPEAGSGDNPPFSQAAFFEGGVVFYRPKRQDSVDTTDQGIILFNEGGWRRLDLA